jgi:hypothetical protein
MSEFHGPPPGRRVLLLGCAIFAVVGAAVMIYLDGFALTSKTKYHADLTQAPQWIAYHNDAFAKDDLLVEYGAYNETPLQNAIYWVGTWFIDVVVLNRMIGVVIFGLTAALFFLLVTSTAGLRTGLLASLFFVIFPRSAYEIAGGFSKAWAIGLTLAAVYVVETRRWKILLGVMPFAAVAYPMAAVLTGAVVLVGLALELPRSRSEALSGFKHLAAGSALALAPLLYKYFTPPARIGEMISTGAMKGKWAQGISLEATLPLWKEVLSYLQHPFFIVSLIVLLMLLSRRSLVWERSWSALVIGSALCYYAADLVVPRLFLPDRYSRYSIAVLLVLWFGHNWNRLLEEIRSRWIRRAAFGAVVLFAAASFPDTFKPCDGEKWLGRWEDKGSAAPLSRAIASLPPPVLLAGFPYPMGDFMIQSRRPVLVIHRLSHFWFRGFREAVEERLQDTFRALYAQTPEDVNRLASKYGVTHLVIPRYAYSGSRLRTGKSHVEEYDDLIGPLVKGKTHFLLDPPPVESIVYEDLSFWLVRLPLEEPASSGNESAGPMPDPSREEKW